jgi:hypothetical protein
MVRELAVDKLYVSVMKLEDMMYLGYIAKRVGVRVSPLAKNNSVPP